VELLEVAGGWVVNELGVVVLVVGVGMDVDVGAVLRVSVPGVEDVGAVLRGRPVVVRGGAGIVPLTPPPPPPPDDVSTTGLGVAVAGVAAAVVGVAAVEVDFLCM
jgi:hypothetical protein